MNWSRNCRFERESGADKVLDRWLTWIDRPSGTYTGFEVTDVSEAYELAPETSLHLVDLLSSSMFDPEELNAFAVHLGWSVKEVAGYRVPSTDQVKRGDFGEVLMSAVMEQFHDYEVPVQKLRHKLMGNQTLPATDVLAIRVDDTGSVEEVCFVESKVRTARDNDVAVEGCEQLRKDYDSETPAILPFVFTELRKKRGEKDTVFLAFRAYLRDRDDNKHLDTFRLALCWEDTAWREKVLENLEENLVALNKLHVHVVRLGNFRHLTEELFAEVGIHGVSEDE